MLLDITWTGSEVTDYTYISEGGGLPTTIQQFESVRRRQIKRVYITDACTNLN